MSQAAPANDDFPGTTISGASGSTSGTTAAAGSEPGEPVPYSAEVDPTVWYAWTAPATASIVFDTCDAASYDSVLAVYTGSSVDSLTRLAYDDDGCTGLSSRITFSATEDTTYYIQVSGFYDESGSFTLHWGPDAVAGTVAITPDPFVVGNSVTVTVTDNDLNTDTGSEQSVSVTVTSSTGESEALTLTETGANTGIFSGTLNTTLGLVSGTNNDGTVNAESGTVLTASYTDASPSNVVTDTATAQLDTEAVVTRTTQVISNFLTEQAELLTTSEPDLIDRLTGGGDGGPPVSFSLTGTPAQFSVGFSTSLGAISRALGFGSEAASIVPAKSAQVVTEEVLPAKSEERMLAYGPTAEPQPGMGGGIKGASAGGAPAGRAPGADLWAQGHYEHVDRGETSTDFIVAHFGVDYALNPNLLFGIMGQVDWTEQSDDSVGSSIGGRGWMVGPYVVMRAGSLVFDARGAYGQGQNHVDPYGLYEDEFTSTRWLGRARITGDFVAGNVRFSPYVSGIYLRQEQQAYTDSLNVAIPGQTVTLGRLTFGPRVSVAFERDGRTFEPHIGMTGIWDFVPANYTDPSTGIAPASTETRIRGRVEGGITVRGVTGFSLTAEGFYDGIGADNYVGYGGSVRLNVPVN